MKTGRVQVDGELTIYSATELKPELLAALNGAAQAEFDLSGVTEIDTAGVQLLLLARREAQARGVALHLRSPSPAVRSAFALLALDAHLAAAEPGPA
jgi:anti-sigma B factor antagonist